MLERLFVGQEDTFERFRFYPIQIQGQFETTSWLHFKYFKCLWLAQSGSWGQSNDNENNHTYSSKYVFFKLYFIATLNTTILWPPLGENSPRRWEQRSILGTFQPINFWAIIIKIGTHLHFNLDISFSTKDNLFKYILCYQMILQSFIQYMLLIF